MCVFVCFFLTFKTNDLIVRRRWLFLVFSYTGIARSLRGYVLALIGSEP